jgi:hypothetical protein
MHAAKFDTKKIRLPVRKAGFYFQNKIELTRLFANVCENSAVNIENMSVHKIRRF